MTQEKATARPWSVAVETEAEDGLTITIPEIGRCLHGWEWADAEEWDRDLANADLIVAAVNERDALLSEVAQLKQDLKAARAEVRNSERYQAALLNAETPDVNVQEVREVLDGLRGRYVKNCWCDAGDDAEHYVSCQRACALMEKLEIK